MLTSYKTIQKPGTGLFKDRGSKFLSFAHHVMTEEQARDILDELRKSYHDARHHCYAWRLGHKQPSVRANDDGEPSNSAGKPILNQIEQFDLTNVLVVVVRYFGGTLLGVSGLINAYKAASEAALSNCKIIRKHLETEYNLRFEYGSMNQVMKILDDLSLIPYDQQFDVDCSLKFRIRMKDENTLVKKIKLIDTCEIKKEADEL